MTLIDIMQYNNSYLKGLGLSIVIMIPSFLFHEICHAIAALRYQLKPEKIEIRLYLYLFPLFYVKIPEIYTVNRGKRIKIMLAGMIGNVFLASASLLAYLITLENIFLIIITAQINIIIANLNPFSLSDGYFIATQIFKLENMRMKIFDIIANLNIGKYKKHKEVFAYLFVNLVFIIINIVYISNYTLNILNEKIGIISNYLILIFLGLFLFSLYLVIIHLRFRKGK